MAGFFKSVYHNGLINTFNEGFLHNREKKTEHLQFANHQSRTVTQSAPVSSKKLESDNAPPRIRLRSATTTPQEPHKSNLPISEGARTSKTTSRKYCERYPNDVQKITKVKPSNPPPRSPESIIKPIISSDLSRLPTAVTPLSPRSRGGSIR